MGGLSPWLFNPLEPVGWSTSPGAYVWHCCGLAAAGAGPGCWGPRSRLQSNLSKHWPGPMGHTRPLYVIFTGAKTALKMDIQALLIVQLVASVVQPFWVGGHPGWAS